LESLLQFFREAQVSIFSVPSELFSPLEKTYSLYVFGFQTRDEFLLFKSLYNSPNPNSVLFLIFPEGEEWDKDVGCDFQVSRPMGVSAYKTLSRALELAYLRELEDSYLLSQAVSLNPSGMDVKSKFLIQKKSIYSLTTSLSQGSGFGTSVTLIDMIDFMKKDMGDHYQLEKELINLLIENNSYSRNLLEGLQSMVRLLGITIELEKISITQFLTELPIALKGIASHLGKKEMELIIHRSEFEGFLEINRETIFLMAEELLLNALKYSITGSKIEIRFFIQDEKFVVQYKNQVHPEFYGGVPPELENVVREPFIRIYPPGDEPLSIIKFGLGLGLTAIDYIVNQHNASFVIRDEFVPKDKGHDNFVIAEVFLPIFQ
jgi:signal transduction histidine kinase